MPLGIQFTGASWPDGTLATDAKMRELANPVATLSGTVDSFQVTDGGITLAKLASATKSYINFGMFNVRDYGATGDGTTNDSSAIQSAIDAAEVAGGAVLFPAGTYYCPAEITVAPSTAVEIAFVGFGNATITTDLLPVGNTGKNLFKVQNRVDSFYCTGLKFRNTRQAESIAGFGALSAFNFSGGETGRAQSNISFFDCEFWNFMVDIVLFNDVSGTLRRWSVSRCKFLADQETHEVRYDSNGDTVIDTVGKFTSLRCYQNCYDIIITDNIYDGAVGNSAVNWTNKWPRDGFVFFTLPQRCNVSNNIVRNFGVEGIYIINWTGAGASGTEASANQYVITGNIVDGTQPAGGSQLAPSAGIRFEGSGGVIATNRIRNCQAAVLVTPQATGYVANIYNLITGNNVTMAPKAKVNERAVGIGINPTVGTTVAGFTSVIGNQIDWADSYADGSVGTTLYHAAIDMSAGTVTATSNTILVRTKAGGTAKACAFSMGNGLSNAHIHSNTIHNADIGFYFGNTVPARIDNNRCLNVTEVAAGNYAQATFGRTAMEFTPTTAGWHTVLRSNRLGRGKLLIGMDYEYGTGDVATSNQSRMEVDWVTNLTGKKLRIDLPDFQNTRPITGVRFRDSFFMDINIASAGTPKRIFMVVECEDQGFIPVDPMQSSTTQNVTASTVDCLATIPADNQAVEILAVAAGSTDLTGGGIVKYVGTADPTATPPTGATQGSEYVRVGGTNGNVFVYKNTTWTAV